MPRLVFIGDNFPGRVYNLIVEKTTVGRAEQNVLVIPHDSVSKHHAEVLIFGPEVIVRDLGSTNGTFVNGASLDQNGQRQLLNGQTVKFGSIEARLELEEPDQSDTSSDFTAIHAFAKVMKRNGAR